MLADVSAGAAPHPELDVAAEVAVAAGNKTWEYIHGLLIWSVTGRTRVSSEGGRGVRRD